MSETRGRLRVVVAPSARSDIGEALVRSHEKFGQLAAERYRDQIKQALRDIATDPELPGSIDRRDLARGVESCTMPGILSGTCRNRI